MEPVWSCGAWIKRRRRALDLTQEELAARVGCSVELISKIETDARRPSRQVAERMAQALDLDADSAVTFVRVARGIINPERLPHPAPAAPLTIPPAKRPDTAVVPSSGALTFLFSDIAGSTRLWEQHPHAMSTALARHNAIMRRAVVAQSGTIFKTVGDAVHAVFVNPFAALSAALAAQQALAREDWHALELATPLLVRMALHSGIAEARDGDYFGPTLNRAARLRDAAHGGQTLLSRATFELLADTLPASVTLRDLGAHRLKDLARAERIFQVDTVDLPTDFPPPRTLTSALTNLPAPPTALVGRAEELATVGALLRRADVRLVTLTGAGGSGKTRLALAAAAEQIETFADGVWFVDLAAIRDPAQVAPAVARALGLQDLGTQPAAQRVRAALRAKRLLLLLDNLEQVTEAAPLLADWLAGAPGLTILATSRVPLHLRGEHLHSVPPLRLPARQAQRLDSADEVAAVRQYDAVALFLARAEEADEAFAIDRANAPAIAEICWRLDGLPLAIELAAARVRRYPPEALLARLEQDGGLSVLTGGPRDLPARQQTLRATIGWSYGLLSDAEQALLARLGIFAGSFDLEAAAAVAGDPMAAKEPMVGQGRGEAFALDGPRSTIAVVRANTSPVLAAGQERAAASLPDLLDALVEHSLVTLVATDDAPRFVLLETVRAYARERLVERGAADTLAERYAAYYVALAEEAEPHTRRHEQLEWLARLDAEDANLQAVLRWGLGDAQQSATARTLGLRLAGALWYYWFLRGRHSEAYHWLESSAAHDPDVPAVVRARALLGAAWIEYIVTWRGVIRQRDKGYALACESGDPWLIAFGQAITLDLAERDTATAQAVTWEHRDPWLAAMLLVLPGPQLVPDTARRRQLEQGLTLARQAGERYMIVETLTWLASCAYVEARIEETQSRSSETHTIAMALGFDYATVMAGHVAILANHCAGRLDRMIVHIRENLAHERAISNLMGVSAQRATLLRHCLIHGDLDEVERLLHESAITAPEEGPDPAYEFPLRYHATAYWFYRIALCVARGDTEGVMTALHPTTGWPTDNGSELARCLTSGLALLASDHASEASIYYQKAIILSQDVSPSLEIAANPNIIDVSICRAGLSMARVAQSDLASARALLTTYQQQIARIFAIDGIAWLADAAARIRLACDEPHLAAEPLAIALHRVHTARAAGVVAPLLERAAEVAFALQNPAAAARWLAAATALRERLGTPPWPLDRPRLEKLRADLCAALGADAFAAAWDAGAALTWRDAADEAIRVLGALAPCQTTSPA